MELSEGEETFYLHLRAYKIDRHFVREFNFHETRKWAFDFSIPGRKIAVEVEGGTLFGKSRHSRGEGFVGDCDKYNEATRLGWRVFRFTTKMVKSGIAINYILKILQDEGLTA